MRGALAGLVVAIAYAAVGVTHLNLPSALGMYLRWALLPCVPIAVFAIVTGILTHLYPVEVHAGLPSPRRRSFPVEAVAVSSIGMTLLAIPLMGATNTVVWYWLLDALGTNGANTAEPVLGRVGGSCSGRGSPSPSNTWGYRLITVPAAAVIAALINPIQHPTALGVAFVIAVCLWWGRPPSASSHRSTSPPRRPPPVVCPCGRNNGGPPQLNCTAFSADGAGTTLCLVLILGLRSVAWPQAHHRQRTSCSTARTVDALSSTTRR